ncbi:MAG: hypothetical protein GY820_40340, partial [Gammaproteobacteria bacterium]|nr:hypothetical protein [Gammaproteobacteria bacterium]
MVRRTPISAVRFRLEEKMVRRVRRIIFFFHDGSASRRRWYGGGALGYDGTGGRTRTRFFFAHVFTLRALL